MLLATINSSIILIALDIFRRNPSRPADAGEHELPTQDHGMPAGRLRQCAGMTPEYESDSAAS
jgi:hypothetical protein